MFYSIGVGNLFSSEGHLDTYDIIHSHISLQISLL